MSDLLDRVSKLETKNVMTGITSYTSPNGVLDGTTGVFCLQLDNTTDTDLDTLWICIQGTTWREVQLL